MSEEIKIEESSGNVFLDIGFSEEEAEYHQLRVNLAFAIHRLLEEQKLTPAKAKVRFGLDPSDVSRLKKMDFTDFTIEQLLVVLKRLDRNIEIRITPSEDTQGHLHLVTT